jgi:hypothetical protein
LLNSPAVAGRQLPARALLLCAVLLAAGSFPIATVAEPGASCALLLTTAEDWPSASKLSTEVGRRSALPVRNVRGISPRLFGVTLETTDAAACRRAIDQLAADRSFAVSVEPDRRRTLPRPSGSTPSR